MLVLLNNLTFVEFLVVKHEDAKSIVKVSVELFWPLPTRLLENLSQRLVELALFQNGFHGLTVLSQYTATNFCSSEVENVLAFSNTLPEEFRGASQQTELF
jgi:hypothetical protein